MYASGALFVHASNEPCLNESHRIAVLDRRFFPRNVPRFDIAYGQLTNAPLLFLFVLSAGNAAWAHIRAMQTLTREPDAIGGLPVFISDDTPIEDTTRFCQRVSRAGQRQRLRLRPTWWSLPTMLTYFAAVLLELLVRWLVRPLMLRWRRHDWRLSFSPCALVAYGGSIILFSRLRASIHLDYEPIFNEAESILRSANWYEKWYDSRYGDADRRTTAPNAGDDNVGDGDDEGDDDNSGGVRGQGRQQ